MESIVFIATRVIGLRVVLYKNWPDMFKQYLSEHVLLKPFGKVIELSLFL